jgi:serine/threonine protein kinase
MGSDLSAEAFAKTEIEYSDKLAKNFEFLELLGRGTFGQVHLVRRINGFDKGKLYALKCIKKTNLRDRLHMDSSAVELNILQKLDNPMLVRMHYAFQSADTLYMAIDYCPGGELFFYLQQIGKFKEKAAKFYAANVLLALNSLHEVGVLYRDLKPENILVDKDGYLKLTDFGLSKIENQVLEGEAKKQILGTPEYTAPEVLHGNGYEKPAEWWAFGCLVYEFLVGIPPFFISQHATSQPSKIIHALQKLIKNCEPCLEYRHLSPDAKDLLSKLLCKDPETRLGTESINDIMNHKWFSDVNWD